MVRNIINGHGGLVWSRFHSLFFKVFPCVSLWPRPSRSFPLFNSMCFDTKGGSIGFWCSFEKEFRIWFEKFWEIFFLPSNRRTGSPLSSFLIFMRLVCFVCFFFPVFFTFIFESLRFDLPDFTWLCVCFSFFLMRPLSVRRPWHSARTEIQGGSCFFFVLFLYCFFTPRKPVFTSFFKTNFRFPYSFSGFSVSVFLFHYPLTVIRLIVIF